MTDDHTNEVVTLLANDALEATGDAAAQAAIILIDAAMVIILTRLDRTGALEMSGILAGYLVEQTGSALATKP